MRIDNHQDVTWGTRGPWWSCWIGQSAKGEHSVIAELSWTNCYWPWESIELWCEIIHCERYRYFIGKYEEIERAD